MYHHPTPSHDELLKDNWEKIGYADAPLGYQYQEKPLQINHWNTNCDNMLFAFINDVQVHSWLGKDSDIHEWMHTHQLALTTYVVPDSATIVGDSQVVFVKEAATMIFRRFFPQLIKGMQNEQAIEEFYNRVFSDASICIRDGSTRGYRSEQRFGT